MTQKYLNIQIQKLEGEVALRVNGHTSEVLPNTLNVSFPHIHANTLLSDVGDKVAASAGKGKKHVIYFAHNLL